MENVQATRQQILDEEHLRLLSIFHYIYGGITAVLACIPIIHLVLGLLFLLAPHIFGHGKDQPPAIVGWIFTIVASVIICLGWTFAGLVVFAGRSIAQRKRATYCFVVACLECLALPYGTILGAFTITVLNRPSVKRLFSGRPTS